MLSEKSAADGFARRRIPAARLADLGAERLAEGLRDEPCGVEDPDEVDAMLEARRIEQVHEILRGEVAGRARSVRAAARATRRAVEGANAGFQRRDDIREGGASCVVEVERHLVQLDSRARGGIG